MGRVTWDASGGGTQSMSPGDHPLTDDQSAATDARFGGHREYSQVANAKDYTARSGDDPQKEENPVDETVRDVDDMSDVNDNTDQVKYPRAKKREFSRRDETEDVQKSNESIAVQSDPDNRPRMNEGSDAVQVPEVVEERQRKKANPWQYDTSSTYEGEIS